MLVVGRGLIGFEIAFQAKVFCSRTISVATTNTDWNNPAELKHTLSCLVEHGGYSTVDLVWAAGKGGFSASDAEMENEYNYYKDVVVSLLELPDVELRVSLISSAGGIYEHSGFVSALGQINYDRPYARWKLEQERLVLERSAVARVYRAASVYGLGLRGSRVGLINRMVMSAIAGSTVEIYALQNTLRDYIFNGDIARHVVGDIVANTQSGVQLLASGRPTSIDTLKNIVSKVTNRRLKLVYVPSAGNDKDILFAPQLTALRYQATSLEEGVRLLAANIGVAH
ncbi:hypothetical protein DFR28_102919 [Arenicella xantha]|uniref:NAD-dependent epimerase/dehydratase domain-containing protein n=1 Tax=Arenicella xantha TaxID=644221 RepID=A0A395JLK8_9GAMM|nr:hypothetical protein DFR28_102919 [Arenicella xantha]